VPLETVSLQKEYWRDVVQYTLAEAQRGRTPNPDVMCNSRVKFGTFYDYVGRCGAC
jgi:tRNA-specific 2-thiouridylase